MSMRKRTASRWHVGSHFDLAADLDVPSLSAAFAQRERLLISGVLRVDCARALSELIARERVWRISLSANAIGRRFESRSTLNGMQMRDAFDVAYSTGGKGGSHLYETFSLESQSAGPCNASPCYAAFAEFINSERFLTFVRAVTGIESIVKSTAFASRYCPGAFYSFHTDGTGGQGQRASFVLNLTPYWEPQWGGLLQFKGASGCIETAYVPRFNSLSIFSAAQPHAVSMVAPFAQFPRISVGGALVT